jgi:two-component system, LytTR family, response regulator
MKALIIDNEEQIRNGLIKQLERFCPLVTSIDIATGVESGILQIQTVRPDIVFLDVEMGDGTGFDLLRKLGSTTFQLVFITAHDKYAVNAFKMSAIDFLLKPIDPEELIASVEKAKKNVDARTAALQYQNLHESLSTIAFAERKMILKDSESIYVIKIADIIYCMAEGPYTTFYLSGSHKITISKNLKEYDDLLEPLGFARPHRSYLINIRKITRFDKADGGMLVMENNLSIPVSVRKKEEIMEMLNSLS